MAGSKGMRNAGIKITIDGERELTAQIKNLRTQYQSFTSEIDKNEAEFAGQRNTLKAVETQYKAIQNAMKSLRDINQTLIQRGQLYQNSLEKEQQKLKNLGATISAVRIQREKAVAAGDVQKVERLDHLLESLNLKYTQQKAVVADTEKELNKNTIALNKNGKEIANLAKEEAFYKAATDDAKKSGNGFTKMLDEFGRKAEFADGKLEELARRADIKETLDLTKDALGTAMEMFRRFTDEIDKCVQAYYDFEKAAISVSKTVPDLSDEQASELIDSLSQSMPFSREDIASVLSQGGQYGISRNALESYSKAMLALASATNIQIGDLGELAQVSGLMEVAEDEYERLGSVLTDLGNKTRTTEKDTINLARGFASQASIIGLSADETIGYANILAATGGQARGAGTAMGSFMSAIHEATLRGGDELEAFARVAGMSADEFKQAFETDASNAILALLKGMNRVVESGGNIYEVFDSIGMKNEQEQRNLKNLAVRYDEVVRTLGIARTAWDENTALMTEFGKAIETNSSQVALFENKVDGLKKTIGQIWSEEVIAAAREKIGNIVDRINNQIIENRDNPNPSYLDIKGLQEYNKQYEEQVNAFGQTDITIPVLFDYDAPSNRTEIETGAASFVSQFAEMVKNVAVGADDPYLALYGAWTEHREHSVSELIDFNVSQLIKEYDNFLAEAQAKVEPIAEAFEKAYDPIKEFSSKGQTSLKEFRKNLETNRKAMEDYADNIAAVMADENLSDAFKSYLKNLDFSEGSKLLEDLVNASDDTKKNVSDNFDAMQQSIADSSSEFAVATGEVTSAIIDGMDSADLPGELAHDGYESVQGLIKSLSNKVLTARLAAASRNLGKIVNDNYRAEQKIQSPSKVMEESAENDVLGLIKGHKDKEAELRESAIRMAQITRDAYLSSLVNMSGGISATINASTRDYTGVLNQISRNTGRNNTVIVEKPSGKTSQSAVNDLERALVRGMLY